MLTDFTTGNNLHTFLRFSNEKHTALSILKTTPAKKKKKSFLHGLEYFQVYTSMYCVLVTHNADYPS